MNLLWFGGSTLEKISKHFIHSVGVVLGGTWSTDILYTGMVVERLNKSASSFLGEETGLPRKYTIFNLIGKELEFFCFFSL